MGKGSIISGGEDGQYSVQLMYDRTKADKALARINSWITMREEQIEKLRYNDPDNKIPGLKLALASLQKQKEYLERIPADPTVDSWCADLSEDLGGNVATIEINGTPDQVLIRPGYDDAAAYDSSRDGILQHIMAMTPEQAFYNLAMSPGWKKWMPTYRIGVLTSVDVVTDTCSLDLVDATAEIVKASPVSINEAGSLSDVPIAYMSCNSAAFEVGDRVVVEFVGQDFDSPKVIGFESSPKECTGELLLVWSYTGGDINKTPGCWFVWDPEKGDYADRIKAFDKTLLKTVVIDKSQYPVAYFRYSLPSLNDDGRVSSELFSMGTSKWEDGIPLLGHFKPNDFVYLKDQAGQTNLVKYWSRISHIQDGKVYLLNPERLPQDPDYDYNTYCMSVSLMSVYVDSQTQPENTIYGDWEIIHVDNFTDEQFPKTVNVSEGGSVGEGSILGSFSTISGPGVLFTYANFNSYATNKYESQVYLYLDEYGQIFNYSLGQIQANYGKRATNSSGVKKTRDADFESIIRNFIDRSNNGTSYDISTDWYSEVRFVLRDAVGYVADCANDLRGAE